LPDGEIALTAAHSSSRTPPASSATVHLALTGALASPVPSPVNIMHCPSLLYSYTSTGLSRYRWEHPPGRAVA
jgi:hypothetical protein